MSESERLSTVFDIEYIFRDKRAVRLPVTGEIDAATWQRITELYNFTT